MAITLPSNALVTEAEVQRDSLGATRFDFSGNTNAVRRAIIDATAEIEAELDRNLMLTHQTQWIEVRDWNVQGGGPRLNTGLQLRWECTVQHWPAVEITDTAVGRYGYSASENPIQMHPTSKLKRRRFWTQYPYDWEVRYFAGYRRQEATLTEIQNYTDPEDGTGTPYADLAVLPPPLPGDIYEACLELVLIRLFEATNKMWGAGSKKRLVGQDHVEVESRDFGAKRRILNRLAVHKRLR